ncbi:hypothetical protein H2203_006397 [Taxawa tesnikishii (nom. ined.)]|nr:hypothetical protein H2203_006397 [Dothideales sp. JES 119]
MIAAKRRHLGNIISAGKHFHTSLISTAVLAYTLGLRHALDADHISAIDLMTRRLIASGQRPVTVGTFFSLGHSTIVIITSIVVASTAAAVSERFGSFSRVGGIIGTSVSATFLIVLGLMNIYILYKLVSQLQKLVNSPAGQTQEEFKFEGGGCLFQVLKKMFRLIDRYGVSTPLSSHANLAILSAIERPYFGTSLEDVPLGVLFGLGFDTSSEIALLGISAISASQGTSFWLILLFPVLFTAGMCLLDTLDGALMMSLYTSTRLAKDGIAVLYYQSVLTGVTVLVAIVIGVIQLLNLVLNVAEPEGKFWEGVGVAGDHYDIIGFVLSAGGAICGSFVVFGLLSFVLYRPWRRRVNRKREALRRDLEESESSELDALDDGQQEQSAQHGAPEVLAQTEGERATICQRKRLRL